jgi:hypothetical protein
VVFLIVLFILNNKTIFTRNNTNTNGLSYSNATLGEVVSRDTDGDGILDWEESLWGTDPNNKETTAGIPDGVVIAKLKTEQEALSGTEGGNSINNENLTQTDKLSRELFSTVTALSQNGEIDQTTVEKLSNSIAEKIKNPIILKVFTMSELKITTDASVQALKTYNTALENIYKKNPQKDTVMDVLQDFIIDEENVDSTVLVRLNPIKTQVKNILNDLVKTTVPQYIATEHLNVINGVERLYENINDIQLFDTDIVVALGAINQYENNTTLLSQSVVELNNKINKKLSN